MRLLLTGSHLEGPVVLLQVVDLAAGAGLLLPHAVQAAFPGSQLLLLPPYDGLLSSGLLFGHAQVVLQPSSCCW